MKKTYHKKQLRYCDSLIFYLTTFIFLAILIYLSLNNIGNIFVPLFFLCLFHIPSYLIYKQLETRKRIKRITKWKTLNELYNRYIDKPTDFEEYVADLFRLQGYNANVTPAAGDGGIDILLYKDKAKYVVEVKLYSPKNKIGREKIQKLHSAMLDSATKADGGFFVTTSDFISSAKDYAQRNNITCINGNNLIDWIAQYSKKEGA